MSNQIVETIHLSGADAVEFANSLFRPTREIIADNRQKWNEIDKNVAIKRKNNGFEVEIADLDLSFLDNIPDQEQLNIEITLRIKSHPTCYQNSKKENSQPFVGEKGDNKFNALENSKFLVWAA